MHLVLGDKDLGYAHWYLGPDQTNNTAEYSGLLLGLMLARAFGIAALDVRMDADLVVKQVNQYWMAHNPRLRDLRNRVQQLRREGFSRVDLHWISRDYNVEADRMAALALQTRKSAYYDMRSGALERLDLPLPAPPRPSSAYPYQPSLLLPASPAR